LGINKGYKYDAPQLRIEFPMINHKQVSIGFCDLFLNIYFKRPRTKDEIRWECAQYKEKIEYAERYIKSGFLSSEENIKTITDNQKIIDDIVSDNSCVVESSLACFIEVKTKLNLGETIRQINYYRHNSMYRDSRNCRWIVCCSEDKHKQILEEQDIGFIHYKP